MFVAELNFQILYEATGEELDDAVSGLLGSLRMNGQILGREFPVTKVGNSIRAFVMLPNKDALDSSHHNKYVRRYLITLAKAGLAEPSIKVFGADPTIPESHPCDKCKNPDSYILLANYLLIGSPLHCGNCFSGIPLYQIPQTADDEYHDIISWESDYQACDRLQMNCSTGEKFGIREMSQFDSSLSKRGRKICNKIEPLTGKPTYYYLFRYKCKSSLNIEKKRPCPSCGGEWLLDERWHIFDFKCDTCRLLSNISYGI